jgi:tetratricopeptide (TPR) repeat protein
MNTSDSIGIDNTHGDVIGGKVEGIGNIAGKEVSVTIQGNVYNLGSELKEHIKEILTSSVRVPKSEDTHIENAKRIHQAKTAQQNIQQIIRLVKEVEKEAGEKPEEIKAGEYNISANYLMVKNSVLEGNKCYFKREYMNAIARYDEAIDIDPYYADAWYNKGSALEKLGKYDEAIRCYDNAIDIDPSYSNAWYGKGKILYNKTSKQKIIISMVLVTFMFIILFYLEGTSYFIIQNFLFPLTYATPFLIFFFFWYKEGNIYYRRLSKKTKIIIIIIGIAIITVLLSSGPNNGSIAIGLTFMLFLYNILSPAEYYFNKAKELGKSV